MIFHSALTALFSYVVLSSTQFVIVDSFQPVITIRSSRFPPLISSSSGAATCRHHVVLYAAPPSKASPEIFDLKSELHAYLKLREELKADEASKAQAGKIVGGSRGNKILEYVSVAPKEMELEESNPFDYDELTKYGYSHCVKPIMELGGRREAYKLMGMVPPKIPDVSIFS